MYRIALNAGLKPDNKEKVKSVLVTGRERP
jgi:hypothetical protein